MTTLDYALKFLNSKWFLLGAGIGMGFLVPICWTATKLKPGAGNIIILVIACVTTFLFFYKFFEKWNTKQQTPQQQSW
jgi:hypothetical protein